MFAALSGYMEVLQWLRAQDPPCPWDERTCACAAEAGNVDVLQWLRAQDPPCSSHVDGYVHASSSAFDGDLSEVSDSFDDYFMDDLQPPD